MHHRAAKLCLLLTYYLTCPDETTHTYKYLKCKSYIHAHTYISYYFPHLPEWGKLQLGFWKKKRRATTHPHFLLTPYLPLISSSSPSHRPAFREDLWWGGGSQYLVGFRRLPRTWGVVLPPAGRVFLGGFEAAALVLHVLSVIFSIFWAASRLRHVRPKARQSQIVWYAGESWGTDPASWDLISSSFISSLAHPYSLSLSQIWWLQNNRWRCGVLASVTGV